MPQYIITRDISCDLLNTYISSALLIGCKKTPAFNNPVFQNIKNSLHNNKNITESPCLCWWSFEKHN